MKTYNYFYNGTPIQKSQFLVNVPENWESEVNEYGEYYFGLYSAIERLKYIKYRNKAV